MTTSWIVLVACASPSALVQVPRTESDDAESLEKLEREIERVLPPGWQVTISPDKSEQRFRRDDPPCLLISSKQKVPLEFVMVNAASGQGPSKKVEKIEIQFAASAFISPQEYAALDEANRAANQKRLDFAELRGVRYGFMGAEPIPPSAYDPKSEKERRLVREYGFVWMRTQPKPLPTHYYGTLSFTCHTNDYMHIPDKATAAAYHQIIAATDKILRPYAVAADRRDR